MPTRPLAIVTGASNGIGLELARELGCRGHDLLIAAEDARGLEDAAEALRSTGAAIQTCHADLADPDGVDALVAAIAGRDLDVLCINAGVGLGGAFADTDLDAELRMIDLNCRGAVQLAKPVVRAMEARGQGRILITSSIAATMPAPFEAVYGATKIFLRSFAEALRAEMRGKGVTVTALMPGVTDTNFFRRANMLDTRAGAGSKADPAHVARTGIKALMADDDRVVAGASNKAMAFLGDHLPDPVGAWFHRGLTEPGSGRRTGMVQPVIIGAALVGAGALLVSRRRTGASRRQGRFN